MRTFILQVPDEAAGRIVPAVLEAVEPDSSRHCLMVLGGSVRHVRLGVVITDVTGQASVDGSP